MDVPAQSLKHVLKALSLSSSRGLLSLHRVAKVLLSSILIDLGQAAKAEKELDRIGRTAAADGGDDDKNDDEDVQLRAMVDLEKARVCVRKVEFESAVPLLQSSARGNLGFPALRPPPHLNFVDPRNVLDLLDFERLHDFPQLEKVLSHLSVVLNALGQTAERDAVVRQWKDSAAQKTMLEMKRLQELDDWQTWVIQAGNSSATADPVDDNDDDIDDLEIDTFAVAY
jgi:hypothetical protein